MKGSNFGYLVKEGVRSLWVNRLMSAAAVGVLVACLILVGGAGLFAVNVNSVVQYVENQNEVVAFAMDGITDDQVEELDMDLHMTPNIGEITLVTSEEALEEWKERMGENGDVFDAYDPGEIFPVMFRLQVEDIAEMEDTVFTLMQHPYLQRVNSPQEIANTLTSVRQIVSIGGVLIVGILVVVSLLIIANTIKITVFNRRKEISIMKYVGANDSFIRLPFLVEGLMLGLLAALLAFFAVWGAYEYVLHWTAEIQSSWIQEARQYFIPFEKLYKPLMAAFGALGIGVGALGSMVFVRKYLRV